jgi:branched-chain amino acid aminotransferase
VRITRVEARPLAIPLAQEFHWAGGAQRGANIVLFSVHTDEGVTGHGESIAEEPAAVAAYGQLMARQLVGRSPGDMEAILRSIWSQGRWKMWPQFTQTVFAGIEVACWDALGRALGVPTRTFFGGAVQEELDYFGFLQGDDPETLAVHARQLAGEGYRVIYLKVGRDDGDVDVHRHHRSFGFSGQELDQKRDVDVHQRRRDDDECVAAVREAIGPEPLLRIDPNEAWDAPTAVERIRRLERYGIDWVEQPTPAQDVNGLAYVRRKVDTKIAADQAVFTTGQLRAVLEKEAADVVVQGSHDAGGLLRFRQQAFMCQAHGLQVNRHAFMESELSFHANAQVASTIPNLTLGNQQMHQLLAERLTLGPPPAIVGGRFRPGDAPGHGFELDEDAVGRAHERWQRDGAYNTVESVYVDGEYVDGAAARIPIWDHGVLYGDGIFEGMRLFDGALFRPRDHLARLRRSAQAIGLELPLGEDELLGVIAEVVRRSGLRDAHVRPIVTRGVGMPGIDPSRCERPSLVVAAYPFPPLLGSDPIRVLVSSIARKAPRSVGAQVKSLNYLDGVLAKRQATAAGMHEAIMLDVLGAVAECTGANVFLVVDGGLVTPTTRAALPGITRRTVIELARERGIPVEERDVWPMELYTADAMFATGSGAGIVPIAEVDGIRLGTADDPIVAAIREGYRERTRDPRYLVPVTETSP